MWSHKTHLRDSGVRLNYILKFFYLERTKRERQ